MTFRPLLLAFLAAVPLPACSRSSAVAASTPPVTSAPANDAAAAPKAPAVASVAESTEAPVPAGFPGHHHDIDEPELVHFAATRGTLGGFLYKPKGDGPFPAVVFNHGSEQLPGTKFGQALFYVRHGFVLFVPHRKGHGQSPGEYIVDARDRVPAPERDAKLVALLSAQVDDVADATTYLKSLSFVNPNAVTMTGCSFGGIETLLAAERDLGLRAAVDFAGAAMTWGENAPLRERMRSAARNAKTALFFVQASNDYDTQPSLELAREMDKVGKPHLLKIFPPKGDTAEDGHSFCMAGMQPPWGDDVLAFFAKNGVVSSGGVAGHAK